MRKPLLFLLLATVAATPSLAQRTDEDRESRREKREEAREERRGARAERAEQAQRAPGAERQAETTFEIGDEPRPAVRAERRQERIERRFESAEDQSPAVRPRQGDAARAGIREWREDRADGQASPVRVRSREVRPDSVREWREGEREQLRAGRVQSRRDPVAVPTGARPDRPAPAPRVSTTHYRSSPWRSSWRNDSRYDWRRHRDRNRWRFNLGFYFDPFGWNYRRYPIGWRLWPSYYSRSYWLNDPWMYHLPPAYGPYRWVRYHNDALLVNIYTGQVEDVIYGFFW